MGVDATMGPATEWRPSGPTVTFVISEDAFYALLILTPWVKTRCYPPHRKDYSVTKK